MFARLFTLIGAVAVIGGMAGDVVIRPAVVTSSVDMDLTATEHDCRSTNNKPPMTAERGGYRFQYESHRGVGSDGKECRLYRVRNSPHYPTTPLRWIDPRSNDEIIFDTLLYGCYRHDCGWLERTRGAEQVVEGETVLSWGGINRDQYRDRVDSFRDQTRRLPVAGALWTRIRGVIADARGNPITIGIFVSSSFLGATSSSIQYEVALLQDSVPLHFRALESPRSGELELRWEAVSNSQFQEALLQAGAERAFTEARNVQLSVKADKYEIAETGRLEIVQDGTTLFATTAPAHVPTRRE